MAGSGECENKGNVLPSKGIIHSVEGLFSMQLVRREEISWKS